MTEDERNAVVQETLIKVRKFIFARHTQDCAGMNSKSVIKRGSDTAELIAWEIDGIISGEQPLKDEFEGVKPYRHLFGYIAKVQP